jgi:hypothetical protein
MAPRDIPGGSNYTQKNRNINPVLKHIRIVIARKYALWYNRRKNFKEGIVCKGIGS